jgi:hypothetical protein
MRHRVLQHPNRRPVLSADPDDVPVQPVHRVLPLRLLQYPGVRDLLCAAVHLHADGTRRKVQICLMKGSRTRRSFRGRGRPYSLGMC